MPLIYEVEGGWLDCAGNRFVLVLGIHQQIRSSPVQIVRDSNCQCDYRLWSLGSNVGQAVRFMDARTVLIFDYTVDCLDRRYIG